MTIFNILMADHRRIADLLKDLTAATPLHAAKHRTLLARLYDEIAAHTIAEERAVYIPMKLNEKTRDLVMEAYEEHGLVDHVLHQLENLPIGSETWAAKLRVLTKLIDHHVQEEEGTLFKKMRVLCDPEELEQMAYDFESFSHHHASQSQAV